MGKHDKITLWMPNFALNSIVKALYTYVFVMQRHHTYKMAQVSGSMTKFRLHSDFPQERFFSHII